ncbi:TetR/AcrR family transcriptional regulator [Pseudophaeobacter flagellatus]|uniref:TetR/AcrR family transcriptional regulator n=1 Tax=Pseudophaeobacter flagellatus TaxID=2899119 RepID=UPI001E5B1B20|nr:TetR/AcrR family transcriptional regulator [Pseudophaeobacter flagellatus]MCD9146295.1 TetR family transcriptional regulator [Pseudophaeobacter flagellatus]
MTEKLHKNQRQRAPSQRSLATRDRIFDAAEQLFADRGFEGASIRDIARAAGVQGALVSHHGGSKEALFATVVARRAEELSTLRLQALAAAKAQAQSDAESALPLRQVLHCFLAPFIHQTLHGGANWSAYGRLIAHVSSNPRWQQIAQRCFDPTARVFLEEIAKALPEADTQKISACFVFMVSAMLSLCTSRWRIVGLSQAETAEDLTAELLDFCEAGFRA